MRKAEDLTGMLFGDLTVLYRDNDYITPKGKRNPKWMCECACGEKVSVVASQLKSGKTQSCGCMFSKKENLSGKKFGRLSVIRSDDSKPYHWLCKCSCGNTTVVFVGNLKKGATKSCGCYHKEIVSKKLKENLIGLRFGRLLVCNQADNIKNQTAWECKCDCGNRIIVRSRSLKDNTTTSCGCYKKEVTSRLLSLELENQRFGKLIVIKRNGTYAGSDGTKYSQWLCKCDCGTETNVKGHDLVRGSVSSCGCLISKGEECVRKYLNSLGVKYKTQFWYTDLRSDKGYPLRFDFAILDKSGNVSALIEYQGYQHYVDQPYGFGYQQKNITDKMKKEYCNKNNIKFFEITYEDNIADKVKALIKTLCII